MKNKQITGKSVVEVYEEPPMTFAEFVMTATEMLTTFSSMGGNMRPIEIRNLLNGPRKCAQFTLYESINHDSYEMFEVYDNSRDSEFRYALDCIALEIKTIVDEKNFYQKIELHVAQMSKECKTDIKTFLDSNNLHSFKMMLSK